MKYWVTKSSLSRPGAVTVHLGPDCSYIRGVTDMVRVDEGELKKWKRCQFCFA